MMTKPRKTKRRNHYAKRLIDKIYAPKKIMNKKKYTRKGKTDDH